MQDMCEVISTNIEFMVLANIKSAYRPPYASSIDRAVDNECDAGLAVGLYRVPLGIGIWCEGSRQGVRRTLKN